MAYTYPSTSATRYGATYLDLCLNALFRGVFGTPPATLYVAYGQGAWGSVTEVAGTRAAHKTGRAHIRGAYPDRTVHQSVLRDGQSMSPFVSGESNNYGYVSNTVGSVDATFALVYDAPTGGNLLMSDPYETPKNILGGDVFSTENAQFGYYWAGNLNGGNIFQQLGDWLFRGYPISTPLSVSAIPNLYVYASNLAQFPSPFILPRGVSSWSAPADAGVAGTTARKITNLIDIEFGPATSGGNSVSVLVDMFPSTARNSYEKYFWGSVAKSAGSYSWASGDTLRFPAGTFDIVWG